MKLNIDYKNSMKSSFLGIKIMQGKYNRVEAQPALFMPDIL